MTTTRTPTGGNEADGRRMLAPPGWYQDPSGSGRRRWFDGRRWTARYYGEEDAVPVAPPAPTAEAVEPAGMPVPAAD